MADQPKLGTIPAIHEQRDAVHVAIIPMVAGERLAPGASVRRSTTRADQALACDPTGNDCIGVVDPFLIAAVPAGSRFWLCLHPGSITSLRHDWTHPAFGPTLTGPQSTPPASTNWRTDNVIGMCNLMRETGDYGLLPALADALTEAKCPDEQIIAACRKNHRYDSIDVAGQRLVCLVLGGRLAEFVRWLDDCADEVHRAMFQSCVGPKRGSIPGTTST